MSTEESGYQDFLQRVQPFAVGLSTCTASLDRTAYGQLYGNEEAASKVERRINASYRLVDATDDAFDVAGHLRVTVGDDSKVVLTLECEFEAHFHAEGKVDRKLAERFAETEARLFLWPYFREFISATSMRMSVHPLVLPLTLRTAKSSQPVESRAKAEKTKPAGKRRK